MNKLKQVELIEGSMENIKQKIYYNKDEVDTCLDNLILELQTQAYEMEKSRKQGTPVFIETQLMYYHQSRAYLEVIRGVNEKFGTNYSNNIKKITKHFETKTPAKD